MLFALLAGLAVVLAWVAFGIYEPTVAPTPVRIARDPIEILDLRYMNGEITDWEYDRIKKSLS